MRYGFTSRFCGLALLVLASFGGGFSASAEEAVSQPEPNGISDGLRVDPCASDPSRLGLSRIVEVDTKDGPQFGGGHGASNDFLKDGEVILSFDDGPLRPYTRPILKALAEHCTKATFFMVGRMAAGDPGLVKDIAKAGHTVASHTWSHQNLHALGLLKGRNEFEMGFAAVSKALGRPAAPFFRFPFLSENRSVIDHLKRRNVSALWVDVDSKDYQTRDPKIVHDRIMTQLAARRKGIILMHDIQPSTAHAIKGLLDELHAKGFKVVHIVPKTSVDTIAAYDGAVEKTFTDKAEAAAANPMANRSVVWSMSPSAAGTAKPLGPAPASPGGRSPQKPGAQPPPPSTTAAVPAAANEDLPWLKGPPAKAEPDAASTAVAKPLPAKPPRPKAEKLPWQPNLFGY